MITELGLTNFRGFEAHSVPFREFSVLVGRNNAGKSTIVEALRLVAILTSRYERLTYRPPPQWLDIAASEYGAPLDLRNLQIEFDSLFYEYLSPPAVIEARFASGAAATIYLGGVNRVHATVRFPDGRAARTRGDAARLPLPRVAILPQVGPLPREERILTPDYVLGAIDSPLASTHFRNQLRLFPKLLPTFYALAEDTWPGFKVLDLLPGKGLPGDPLALLVRNEEFPGEVATMGHGLQMWLQTMWFLTRSMDAETLILDEPDVYMHADLQRRLVRHLKNRQCQTILATHSVEIMAEVEPDNVVIIDRKAPRSTFADAIPAVQAVMDKVGTAHNLQLARLWNSRRFLLVEGDDLRILHHLFDTAFSDADFSLGAIPNMTIGGWGGWQWAVGSSMALRNAAGEEITSYCILDRDYHLDREVEERYAEASARNVELHVWRRKELESYLLCPEAIGRLLAHEKELQRVAGEEVTREIQSITQGLRNHVVDCLATSLQKLNHRITAGTASANARELLASREALDGTLEFAAPGKEVLSSLSAWTQQRYGKSLSAVAIARELKKEEIPAEVVEILAAIHNGEAFPTALRGPCYS